MAQRRTTSLVDDLTGTTAVETVRFGLSGPEYEIDLSSEHAQQLRAALSPFIAKARKVRPGRSRRTRQETMRIAVTVDPEWDGAFAP